MIEKINEKQNILGDNIGFIENWDFSKANLNNENRILAITKVASICYQNPKALGSESLYNRLMAESMGLPSSSFEFVPVLIPLGKINNRLGVSNMHIDKFGEIIEHNEAHYLLTNLRALIADVGAEASKRYLNTKEECEIIKHHFKVFLYKVDLPTRSQMVRHRVSWQELSRRYVSGERVPFEFYVSEKMKSIISITADDESDIHLDTNDILSICLNHYKQALKQGIKPQEARRIIPQSAYTQIWGAFMPKQLDNYFKLRLDETAQWEIRQTAIAMQELLGK